MADFTRTAGAAVVFALLLAACSNGVTLGGNALDQAGLAVADEWATEMLRDTAGDGSLTPNEAQCVARGYVGVLGNERSTDELARDQAVDGGTDTTYFPEDADALAEVFTNCVPQDDRLRELGKKLAPFAAAGDLDCFVEAARGDAQAALSLDLQGLAETEKLGQRAAQQCGLM